MHGARPPCRKIAIRVITVMIVEKGYDYARTVFTVNASPRG